MIVPILAIGGFFAFLIITVYMGVKTNHEQKMALIETGQTSDIFDKKKSPSDRLSALKFGLLATGLGIGYLLGYFLQETNNLDELIRIPFAIIGGGLGLIIFYFSTKEASYHED
jgi:hypothetical protein